MRGPPSLVVMVVPTELSLIGVRANLIPELQVLQAPLVRWATELCMLYGELENTHGDVLKANIWRQASDAIRGADGPEGCVLQILRRSLKVLGWDMAAMGRTKVRCWN